MLPLLLSGLLVPLSSSAFTPAGSATAPENAFAEEGSTAEDVEVLRRLLVKGLMPETTDARALDLYKDAQALGTYDRLISTREELLQDLSLSVQGSNVQHSRGFHVPGAGLFYCIELSVPAAAKTETAPNGQPDQSDEWASTQQEVRNRQQGGSTFTGFFRLDTQFTTTWVLDAAAVDKAIEQVIQTLAEHGTRVRGLGPTDAITVALHVSAGSWPSANASMQEDYLGSLVAYSAAREERVVVRIPRSALQGYADKHVSWSQLRAAAEVSRY